MMDFVLLLERYSLLGVRKDYWNFITDCIPRDDGVKYVQAIPQVKKHHFLLSLKNQCNNYINKCIITSKDFVQSHAWIIKLIWNASLFCNDFVLRSRRHKGREERSFDTHWWKLHWLMQSKDAWSEESNWGSKSLAVRLK